MDIDDLKYVIAQLLQDANRIQQLEPNAGTQARIDAALEIFKKTDKPK